MKLRVKHIQKTPVFLTSLLSAVFTSVVFSNVCQAQTGSSTDTTSLTHTATPSFVYESRYGENSRADDWYQIEVVVFKQAQPPSPDAETWPKDIPLRYPKTLEWLTDPDAPFREPVNDVHASDGENRDMNGNREAENSNEAESMPSEAAAPPIENPYRSRSPWELPFVLLDSSAFTLNHRANAVDKQGDMRVLFHEVWRQPIKSSGTAPAIVIHGGDRFGQHNELEGTLRFSTKKILHVTTNLWLTEFTQNRGQATEHWSRLPSQPTPFVPSDGAFVQEDDSEEDAMAGTVSLWQTPTDTPNQSTPSPTPAPKAVSPYVVTHIATHHQSQGLEDGKVYYLDNPRIGIFIKLKHYSPQYRAQ